MSAIQLYKINPDTVPVPAAGSVLVFVDAAGVLSHKTATGEVVAALPGGGGGAGSVGPAGADGAQGAKGDAGAQGLQGVQGVPGVAGAVGAAGAKGDTGAQGLQGLPGVAGPAGAAGGGGGAAITDRILFSSVAGSVAPAAVAGAVSLYLSSGYSSVTAVPAMTSAVLPSGVVSASSQYAATPPYVAFGTGNGWLTNGAALPAWISYQFPAAVAIGAYSIAPWDADTFPTRCPKDWTLQGSTDGANWVTLDARAGVTTWAVGVSKDFEILSPIACAYYRLRITANNGDTYTGVRKLSLFEGGVSLWAVNENGYRKKLS